MATLKSIRSKAGLTQKQLADHLAVSQQTVARWESEGGQIPTKYLRDLAILFGTRIEEFVQSGPAEPVHVLDRLIRGDKNMPDSDAPYGAVEVTFDATAILPEVCHRYPISENERVRIEHQLLVASDDEATGWSWLEFMTLDQRWILVNPSHVLRVSLVSDDVDAMPPYEHLEVYEAARRFELDGMPDHAAMAAEDFPYSRQLMARVSTVLAGLDDRDEAFFALNGLIYETLAGRRTGVRPELETLQDLESMFSLDFLKPTPDRLIEVESEGIHKSTYVRLGAIRLFEVSSLAMLDLRKELEREESET